MSMIRRLLVTLIVSVVALARVAAGAADAPAAAVTLPADAKPGQVVRGPGYRP